MEIKRRAESAPEKDGEHDRQIRKLKTRNESDHSKQLQCDQDNENEQIEFFVLKHAAGKERVSEDVCAADRGAIKSKRAESRTTWARGQCVIFGRALPIWSGGQGLNLRPRGPQPRALP